MLLRRSLNFCSCTTWFLDLDDSFRINKAWLYKGPKVSVLQANFNLVQKGECWTWNQRLWEAWVLFPLGVTFFTGFFYFHIVNSLMPILAISSSLWKPRVGFYSFFGMQLLLVVLSNWFLYRNMYIVEYWIRLNETNSDVRMYTLIIYFIRWRTCST